MSLALPVGMIVASARATVPAGWLACDGTTRTTAAYPALAAALGSAHAADYLARVGSAVPAGSFALPYLVDRHVIGASNTAAVATVSNVNTHTHTFNTSAAQGNNATNRVTGGDHSHSMTYNAFMNWGGSHDHTWGANVPSTFGASNGNVDNVRSAGTYYTAGGGHAHGSVTNHPAGATGDHYHNWNTSYQSNNSGAHTHTVSVGNSAHDATNDAALTATHVPAASGVIYLIRAT